MLEVIRYFIIPAVANFILHFIMYIYNKNENVNNVTLTKTITAFIVSAISILFFTVYYIICKNLYKIDIVLFFYILISLCMFFVHYILDLDIIQQFSKEFNFLLSSCIHITILLIWYVGFFKL